MMRYMSIIIVLLILAGCADPVTNYVTITPEPAVATPDPLANDPRLASVSGAESARWIAYPRGYTMSRAVTKDKDKRDKCNRAGCGYILYEDESIIEFEPSDATRDVMFRAIQVEVQANNITRPDKLWEYIVCPIPVPVVERHDPMLDVWQWAIVDDAGEFCIGPNYCVFDWEWEMVKHRALPVDLMNWNMAHPDRQGHIVLGPDTAATPTPAPATTPEPAL